MHDGSGERSSIRAALSFPGRFDGTRTRAARECRAHVTAVGASKPESSRLYELTHWFVTAVSSGACRSTPARNALPSGESGRAGSGS